MRTRRLIRNHVKAATRFLIVMTAMLLGLSLGALSDCALVKGILTFEETIATQREQLSDYKSVNFKVHVPDNTPLSDTVYLILLPFYDWAELQRIPMTANTDGTWSWNFRKGL